MKKIFLLGLLCLFMGGAKIVSADNEYSIDAIPSKYQHDTKKSYFDLRLAPSQKVTIEIQINNYSKEDATFVVQANNGITSSSLSIVYNDQKTKLDSSSPFSFTDVSKLSTSTVTLAKNSNKKVAIELTMPKEKFDGKLLGGIYVSKELTAEEKKQSGYVTRFSYVKGVVISETDTKVTPNLQLEKINTENFNGNVTISSTIKNPTATVISPLDWEAIVTEKSTGKEVKKQTQKNAMVAPNTIFDYRMLFQSGELKSGEYHLKIVATEAALNKQWVLEKDFSITTNEMRDIENQIATKQGFSVAERKTNILLWSAVGVVLALFIVVIFFLIYKKRRKNDEDKQAEIDRLVAEKMAELSKEEK